MIWIDGPPTEPGRYDLDILKRGIFPVRVDVIYEDYVAQSYVEGAGNARGYCLTFPTDQIVRHRPLPDPPRS